MMLGMWQLDSKIDTEVEDSTMGLGGDTGGFRAFLI